MSVSQFVACAVVMAGLAAVPGCRDVNVITGSVSPGSCVSRFDVTVYTHTTARLSYQPSPVLVQVSLLHRGGISGGASAGHAATVIKGVSDYVDEFIARIKAANK